MSRKNTAWTKEPKLGIASAKKPQEGFSLSGVTSIKIPGLRIGYIKFGARAVKMIGRHMPYGIGPENEAYLQVVRTHKQIEVFCCYMDRSKKILLWASKSLPTWINENTTIGRT